MIVQIYEIQTPQEAATCIDFGVDRIGSVILSEANLKVPQIREAIRLSEGTRTRNSVIGYIAHADCRSSLNILTFARKIA